MIHLALTIAAFLFLCWVALLLFQTGCALFEWVTDSILDIFESFVEAIKGEKGRFARVLAYGLLGTLALTVVAVVAVDESDPNAQYQRGNAYHDGKGVSQDDTQAAVWWRKAAEQGFAPAQYSLGLSCDLGKGVPLDHAQAAKWYRMAAEQGYATAQFNLATSYYNGVGVQQDYPEAFFWYDVAASGEVNGINREDVAKSRDDAASKLEPEVLLQTQERARKWSVAHSAKP